MREAYLLFSRSEKFLIFLLKSKANASLFSICQRNALRYFVEHGRLELPTSTLPFILSIKQFSLPAGFIVEAKSQLASSHSSQMS